jgi:hypothetical protein
VFGSHKLEKFTVVTEELKSDRNVDPEMKPPGLQVAKLNERSSLQNPVMGPTKLT